MHNEYLMFSMHGPSFTGELQNNIVTYTISYNAAYCAMMAHELLRIMTEVSSVILIQAAKGGIVHTMLKLLNVLKDNLGRFKVNNHYVLAIVL